METLHKIFLYLGLVGIGLMCFATAKYFISGDNQITGAIFAIGFILILIPSLLLQVSIPAGLEENLPIWPAVILYVFLFPFINALMIVCIKAIVGDLGKNSSFPYVGVGILMAFLFVIGIVVKITKEKINS